MSSYTSRTAEEAAALVAKRMPIVVARDRLITQWANPVCGKPGRGFKAARKAQATIRQLNNELAAVDTEIDAWITQNRKASMATRGKRFDIYTAALQAWQPPAPLDDPRVILIPFTPA